MASDHTLHRCIRSVVRPIQALLRRLPGIRRLYAKIAALEVELRRGVAQRELLRDALRKAETAEHNLQRALDSSVARMRALASELEEHRSHLAEQVRLSSDLATLHFAERELAPQCRQVGFNTADPLVSVVIPIFNEIDLLRRSLGSVLSQCYQNLEVILVDDGSSENVAESDRLAALDRRVRIFHEPNRKTGGARNFAMDIVRGEYVCFLDTDDWYMPGKIKTQVRLMQQHRAAWSHTSYFAVYPSRGLGPAICASGKSLNGYVFPRIIDNCSISPCTTMLHRAIVEQGYRFSLLTGGEDTIMFCEIASKYPILGIDLPLTTVEYDDDSTIFNVHKYLVGLMAVRDQLRAHPMLSQFRNSINVIDAEIARLGQLSPTHDLNESLFVALFGAGAA